MADIDYAKIGFKSGIEIHQQLETRKLFCNCPSIVHDSNPDIKIARRLRPVVGETGEIDAAAAHEFMKSKSFVYEACKSSSCLVELDEEPPHPMNPEALEIALQIAKLLNAEIADEIQVMRKTVIDGSNVSGFQRTALIARNGHIDTSRGKVGIPIIMIEEEAAKRIKEDDKTVTFRLDRLGVPLIEIGTDPVIKDPEHAKETAEKIGMILRSTGRVKRGIGTIRQDVNMSIKKHPRVEIKGFQDLKSIPKVMVNEIKRMQKEVKSGKKIEAHVRKANADGTTSFLRPMPGAARLYPETDIVPIKPGEVEAGEVELIEDRIKNLEKLGITKDLATKVVKLEQDKFVEEQAEKHKDINPAFIAETVIGAAKQIKSQFGIDVAPAEEDYIALFGALDKGRIAKGSVIEILKENKPVKDVISKYELEGDKNIEAEIKKIVDKNKGAPINALMGMAMAKLKGKAEGKKVMEILKKLAK